MNKRTVWERQRLIVDPKPITIRTRIVGGWVRFQGWFGRNVW
jgi:hypothetical protein